MREEGKGDRRQGEIGAGLRENEKFKGEKQGLYRGAWEGD